MKSRTYRVVLSNSGGELDSEQVEILDGDPQCDEKISAMVVKFVTEIGMFSHGDVIRVLED